MSTHQQERNYLEAERTVLFNEFADSIRPEPTVKYRFYVASDMVVVGYNPEMADFDNPCGQLIEERFYMVAEDAKGYRFVYGNEGSEDAAEIGFQHFAPPVSEWSPIRPAYGSYAYQASGAELEQRIDEFESDLGPDWAAQVSSEVILSLF